MSRDMYDAWDEWRSEHPATSGVRLAFEGGYEHGKIEGNRAALARTSDIVDRYRRDRERLEAQLAALRSDSERREADHVAVIQRRNTRLREVLSALRALWDHHQGIRESVDSAAWDQEVERQVRAALALPVAQAGGAIWLEAPKAWAQVAVR